MLPIKKGKCFQYAVTVALSYEKTKLVLQKITQFKPFINKYNWEGLNFPSEEVDWKNLRKAMEQCLLMFCMLKRKNIYLPYVSKDNSNCEKQVILLMISNTWKWHFLAVKIYQIIKRNYIKRWWWFLFSE